jgi:hypothetical protein
MSGMLTDLESVRQYLQETTDQDVQDDDIEILIPQVSDAIPRYCLREFTPTAGATRSFEFPWEPRQPVVVNTVRYELRTVSKVVVDPDMSGGVELSAEEWRTWPLPATAEGTYYGIRLGKSIAGPSKPLQFPSRRVDITGDWGMAAVPDIIRRYANESVAAWLQLPADGRMFNRAEMEGSAPARPDDLPPGVRFGLKAGFMRPIFSR